VNSGAGKGGMELGGRGTWPTTVSQDAEESFDTVTPGRVSGLGSKEEQREQ